MLGLVMLSKVFASKPNVSQSPCRAYICDYKDCDFKVKWNWNLQKIGMGVVNNIYHFALSKHPPPGPIFVNI